MSAADEFTKDDIDRAYQKLGHRWGWSFMATPEERLRTARVAIVGLNPGGGGEGDNSAFGLLWNSDGVNAYYDEKWGADGRSDNPLQKQVKEWHRLLQLNPQDPLCAQFVPFRSPTFSKLANSEESVEFARDLWRWVLSVSPATLFVTMGKLPARYLAQTMSARYISRLPTGWGRQMIDVYDSPDGKRIIAMPHPSRYRIFARGGGVSDTAEGSFMAAADSSNALPVHGQ
ncbi:hypothetical protein GCM10022280_18640 [Sphingomonas swuensis]|uniref:Uracil-DNA glycosylase-like domain-containing protein n=1 Tax=Sphingomonas swuensis TaxID=977800 RepID=A0ABP7T0K9_9SPHN